MTNTELRTLYLNLLKAALRNTLYRGPVPPPTSVELRHAAEEIKRIQQKFGAIALSATSPEQMYYSLRLNCIQAHTLGDDAALDNVQNCVESVIQNNIPGDLIETGVYRGGQTILMRGVLKAYGISDRVVHVADSFEGLPTPDPEVALADAITHEMLREIGSYAVSEEAVRDSFARYGLMDSQVNFIKGWFAETLPRCEVERFAVIRLDADWYESTKVAIDCLYPKLSTGGFIIIDDYGLPIGARVAVDNYRNLHNIQDKLIKVNTQTVYWQKQ